MVSGSVNHNMRPAWFVNAQRQGLQDQTDRFVEEGIWESLSKDRDTQEVKDAVRRIFFRAIGLLSGPAITATKGLVSIIAGRKSRQ